MNPIIEDRKEIFAAIAKAMAEVKRINKDSRNNEQKYDFASVDDFLAMTGPICAAQGLIILMDETECEPFERQGKYGATAWLRIVFTITVMHVSGQSLSPARRTVEVIRTGAQSFGSAQSYALKQFLRALLQIPTGDKDDPDFGKDQVTEQQGRQNGNGGGRPSQTQNGNGGGRPAQQQGQPQQQQQAQPPKPVDAGQLATIKTLIELTKTDPQALLNHVGASSLEQLTDVQALTAIAGLQKKAKAAEAAAHEEVRRQRELEEQLAMQGAGKGDQFGVNDIPL